MTAFLPSSPRSGTDDGHPSAPHDTAAPPPDGAARAAVIPTAVHCLVAVARHHGVDLSVERVVHDSALSESELPLPRLLRIARQAGFRARPTRLGWSELPQLGGAFPVLARLNNGHWVVLAGVSGQGDASAAILFDPLADQPALLAVPQAAFCPRWTGELVLLKPAQGATDPEPPFGLRWFLPELLRQHRLFRDVAVAALFLYALGLATPVFFQLVIDKVLVHESYATLTVLSAGIGLALVFDAVFTFLRR